MGDETIQQWLVLEFGKSSEVEFVLLDHGRVGAQEVVGSVLGLQIALPQFFLEISPQPLHQEVVPGLRWDLGD